MQMNLKLSHNISNVSFSITSKVSCRKYNKKPKIDSNVVKKPKAGRRQLKDKSSNSEDCEAKKCLRPIG